MRCENQNMLLAFKVIWFFFQLNDPALITHLLSDGFYLRVANMIDTGLDLIQSKTRQPQQQHQENQLVAERKDAAASDAANKDKDSGSSLAPRRSFGDSDGVAPMDIDDSEDVKSSGVASSSGKTVQREVNTAMRAGAPATVGNGSGHSSSDQCNAEKKEGTQGLKNESLKGAIEYGKGKLGMHFSGPQFKQVAQISDPQTLQKIHTNFRALTLVEVVQGVENMLDGALHQSLLSMVAQNSGEILRSLACDGCF